MVRSDPSNRLHKIFSEEGEFITRSLGNAFLNKFVEVQEPKIPRSFFWKIETIFANKFIRLTKK